MKLDVSLKHLQKLTMTKELRQSIDILQYNYFELLEFLKDELETNPTMDMEMDDDLLASKGYENSYDYGQFDYDDQEDDRNSFERYAQKSETLYDYVLEQLKTSTVSEDKKRIGELMLGYMDENGYLPIDLIEFSNNYNVSYVDAEAVLGFLQTFEPLGVCSTNLIECLIKQAVAKGYDQMTVNIIKEDLVSIAENRVEFIAKKYQISNREAQEKFDLIKDLDPKPGKFIAYDDNPIKFIVPDLILEIVDGEPEIRFNDDYYPRIYINEYYQRILKSTKDKEVLEYLKEKIKNSNWVIKSIEQRRGTILSVAKAICEIQKGFIVNKEHLLPMTLSDIANRIEMHESTVSRSVNGKFIQTPTGVFELRDFFKSSIESSDSNVSSEEIKSFIKEVIDAEDKKKPLSDQAITDRLEKLGYKISRRTVTKYREALDYPSSTKRKRY